MAKAYDDVSYALLDEVVRTGHPDAVGVAHEVGASAARMGAPLHEVLDQVERAHDRIGAEPEYTLVRAAAISWAEHARLGWSDHACEDPLTSLATSEHLRTRLAEVYRGAARRGERAAHRHVLVVAELTRLPLGHDLEASLRAIDVAEALRSVFAGDETVAGLTSRRFAVLAERARVDDLTMHLLGLVLRRDVGGDLGPLRVWVEELPPTDDEVRHLMAALTS